MYSLALQQEGPRQNEVSSSRLLLFLLFPSSWRWKSFSETAKIWGSVIMLLATAGYFLYPPLRQQLQQLYRGFSLRSHLMLQRVRQSSELQTALTWCQHVQRRLTHAADRFATTRAGAMLGALGSSVMRFCNRQRRRIRFFLDREVDKMQTSIDDSLLGLKAWLSLHMNTAFDRAVERVKTMAKDPDMPSFVCTAVDDTVDMVVPDVREEMMRKMHELVASYTTVSRRRPALTSPTRTDDDATATVPVPEDALTPDLSETELAVPRSACGHLVAAPRTCLNYLRRQTWSVRCWIMYTLRPYDKSFWKNLKSPAWAFMTVLGVVPRLGQLWWLLLYGLQDRTDEHQVCSFITGFQTARFVSQGLFGVLRGNLRYYWCTTINPGTCATSGPMLDALDGAFFILQIVLVWLSFERLHLAKRMSTDVNTGFLVMENGRNGGHLHKFFWYETAVTTVVLMLVGAVLYSGFEEWKLLATLYWIKVISALLALPFVLFKIPGLDKLLLHTRKTGYNQHGAVVRVKKNPRADNVVSTTTTPMESMRTNATTGGPTTIVHGNGTDATNIDVLGTTEILSDEMPH